MDSLVGKLNARQVRAALENLPEGMDGTYDEAMERVERQDDGRKCQIILRASSASRSPPNNGKSPLSISAENGHEAVVKLFLAQDDVDTDSKTTAPETATLPFPRIH